MVSFFFSFKPTSNNIGMEFDDHKHFEAQINIFGKEKGVKFQPKFMDSCNQYYLYCQHYGSETKISSGCEANLYCQWVDALEEKGKKIDLCL